MIEVYLMLACMITMVIMCPPIGIALVVYAVLHSAGMFDPDLRDARKRAALKRRAEPAPAQAPVQAPVQAPRSRQQHDELDDGFEERQRDRERRLAAEKARVAKGAPPLGGTDRELQAWLDTPQERS